MKLQELQTYANKHWAVNKTRLTTARYKSNHVLIVEKRLWVWFGRDVNPTLVKEDWIKPSVKDYFNDMFDRNMRSA